MPLPPPVYNKLFILYRSVKSNPTSIELWQLLIDLVLLEQSQIQSDTIIEIFETALINLLTNHEIWIQFSNIYYRPVVMVTMAVSYK